MNTFAIDAFSRIPMYVAYRIWSVLRSLDERFGLRIGRNIQAIYEGLPSCCVSALDIPTYDSTADFQQTMIERAKQKSYGE